MQCPPVFRYRSILSSTHTNIMVQSIGIVLFFIWFFVALRLDAARYVGDISDRMCDILILASGALVFIIYLSLGLSEAIA